MEVEALDSRQPWDAKKASITGAGHLQGWCLQAAFRGVRDRWPLTGACPANNKQWECKRTTANPIFVHDFALFSGLAQFCGATTVL